MNFHHAIRRCLTLLGGGLLFLYPCGVKANQSDAILQYFGTSWNDIAAKIPEIAEAGYTALWLPPPFKGTSVWDVGFGTFDRFDLGEKDQNGTIPTKYGTAAELQQLIEMAHRFGIRVYFDNVMAHNGGPIPGYDENTSIHVQPGFVPEDFHLQKTADGYYRNWPGIDWGANDEWQILNRNPFGQDIAHENPNTSFGLNENDDFPKYVGIRQPNNPEYYPDTDLPIAITRSSGNFTTYPFANKEPFEDANGNGRFDWNDANGNGQHDPGETSETFTDTGVDPLTPGRNTATWGFGDGKYNMGNPVPEDVNAMLIRAFRWFTDRYKPDGYRLDAVKHVPNYFFGEMNAANKDSSNSGYLGEANVQFNLSRGYTDWNNHRDTTFSDNPRDDLFYYGEHLGSPPAEGPYLNAGMRIANDAFLNTLSSSALPNSFSGLDSPGYAMYGGVNTGMKYPMSHDNVSLWGGHKELAFLLTYLTAGPGIIYTDGYNQSTGPNYFPKIAQMPFLGQFGSAYATNILSIYQNFARGDQVGKYSTQNFAAFERRDKTENAAMTDADGTVLLVMLGRYGVSGGQNPDSDWSTTFPANARLRNYSYHGGPFYVNVNAQGKLRDDAGNVVLVDGGKYFAFSWDHPELPLVWQNSPASGITPITILQGNQPVSSMTYLSPDGADGDSTFNAGGRTIPRVTSGSNLSFIARADGSAESILLKLDGGMDLNSHLNLGSTNTDKRDYPPGVSRESYLGYEQMRYVQRVREKFAASVVQSNNIIGSSGAVTWRLPASGPASMNNTADTNNYFGYWPTWVYHDPQAANAPVANGGAFSARQLETNNGTITLRAKVGKSFQWDRAWVYYTLTHATNSTYPEGSAGQPGAGTSVAEMTWYANQVDGSDTNDWVVATGLPIPAADQELRYKIGVTQTNVGSLFPWSAQDIRVKKRMESVFAITNFNATTARYRPHNDFGEERTNGLAEGFHVLRARAFLERPGRAAIYNTFVQPFYYDTQRPLGQILYPAANGETLSSASYGVVVRTDGSTSEVWYKIDDGDARNNDSATGKNNGNGAWVKASRAPLTTTMAKTNGKEWRFDYASIPSSGVATIQVRLRELSSSTNHSRTDEEGHFTTLARTVNTRGPSFGFLFPSTNGAVLGTNYTLKVGVDKTLTAWLSDDQIKDRFSLKITSRGGQSLPRSSFGVYRNETTTADAVGFNLPNLNNGISSTVDTLEATWSGTTPPLTATLTFRPDTNTPLVPFLEFASPTNNGLTATLTQAPGITTTQVKIRTTAVLSNAPSLITSPSLTILPPSDATLETTTGTKLWTYDLSGLQAGNYVFTASLAGVTNQLAVMVGFPDANNPDDDGDGLPDALELTATGWPQTSADSWTNEQIHLANLSGKSSPLLADTDADGLTDALELGWRAGGDLDSPLYAVLEHAGTVPGVGSAARGDDRSRLAFGSTTDPAQADSDGDRIPDGIEDANQNGWVDGDGRALGPTVAISEFRAAANRPNVGDWPNGKIDSWETWTETSPNKRDSDDDGLEDGQEDADQDGIVDLGETDPRKWDTDGDGLTDKWEKENFLDPRDSGTAVPYQDLTGLNVTSNPNGGDGDPDSDGRTNLQEQASGTDPLSPNPLVSEPTNPDAGPITDNEEGFLAWDYRDLISHDEYNLGGSLDSVDIHRLDGNDSSRDIAAFSFRDGGATAAGGDGRVYFRVDFLNLNPAAASPDVNVYIVMDTGNPEVGECALPEELGLGTDMRWEAVVAAYRNGTTPARIFVDTDLANNTRNGTDGNLTVSSRDLAPNGIAWVNWSSRFDAVMVAVQRQALLDAGWDGDPDKLGFQVLTTRPGTGSAVNSPLTNKSNRLTDTIADDWVTSDFWKDLDNINLNGKLSYFFGRDTSLGNNGFKYTDKNRYAKVILLAHGNQAIQPGRIIQDLVHDRSATNAAGYFRLLETHEAYGSTTPLTLHLTPTLASALQWAKSTDPRNDGPGFNGRLRGLINNANLDLVGSTFSDHVTKYFPLAFNQQNRDLARQFLNTIYGNGSVVASPNVFWPAERVLDQDSLTQIQGMGYTHTFADQMRHFSLWFGLSSATGNDGFRLNRVNGVTLIPIHDTYSDYLDSSLDEGSASEIRQLLSRRARSSVQDQVTVLWKDMGDFTNHAKASAYHANVRWLASRPYVRVVTPKQILAGQIQYPRQDNGQLIGTWGVVDRGTNNSLPVVAKDWIHHATQENYDNWYFGTSNNTGVSLEEGLKNKQFPGTTLPFGQVGVSGIANSAAVSVNTVTRTGLSSLAQAVLHGAMFQTAFHETSNNDLRKFSTGEYISPDTGTNQALAGFARHAHSQARFARVYQEVNSWSQNGHYRRYALDVDLDGSPEYILSNQRVFAVFEAQGGRMVAAWMRTPDGTRVWQMCGNFASYSGTDTEDEGGDNATAYRTSGFKDWWVVRTGVSSNRMANVPYSANPVGGTNGLGWEFVSGEIQKTIRLPSVDAPRLEAIYQLTNLDKAYIRFGLSPNLEDLLLQGQTHLAPESTQDQNGRRRLDLENTNGAGITRISLWAPQINSSASDTESAGSTTMPRRHQAQTHQVEVELTGAGPHQVTLAFDQGIDLTNTSGPDSDNDGMPDWWESDNFFGDLSPDGTADPDQDGLTDLQEYLLQTNPNLASSGPDRLRIGSSAYDPMNGFSITMQTYVGVKYQLQGVTHLTQGWGPETNIGSEKSGNGAVQTFNDAGATNSVRKFYRITISPP